METKCKHCGHITDHDTFNSNFPNSDKVRVPKGCGRCARFFDWYKREEDDGLEFNYKGDK